MNRLAILENDIIYTEELQNILNTKELEIITLPVNDESINIVKQKQIDILILGGTEDTLADLFRISAELKHFYDGKLPVIITAPLTKYCGYNFDPVDDGNYKPVDELLDKYANKNHIVSIINSLLNCKPE
ncbi:MAG: hypothetical protein AB1782_09980 [Cyanobacteriota bacterium]